MIKRNVIKWLPYVFLEWLIIAGVMWLAIWSNHWLLWLLSIIILGTRQQALTILGHEGTHYLICKNKNLNDFLTVVFCFWPLGISLAAYRKFHLKHHQHVGTDLDPELYHKNALSREQWSLPKTKRQIFTYALMDMLGFGSVEIAKFIWIMNKVNVMFWLPFIGYIIGCLGLCYLGCWKVVVLWNISFMTVFWTVFRLRVWTEHVGTDYTNTVHANWWQRLLFLPHNIWYHWEHHEWPYLPFYDLPAARNNRKSVTVWELYNNLGRNGRTIDENY